MQIRDETAIITILDYYDNGANGIPSEEMINDLTVNLSKPSIDPVYKDVSIKPVTLIPVKLLVEIEVAVPEQHAREVIRRGYEIALRSKMEKHRESLIRLGSELRIALPYLIILSEDGTKYHISVNIYSYPAIKKYRILSPTTHTLVGRDEAFFFSEIKAVLK